MDDLRITKVAAPVRQQLIENLRRAIFEFRYQPGDRLVERELCEITGASRTSVREGLRQLEAEGLIEIVPNKGPVVTKISSKTAAEIYEIRVLLEGLLGRRVAERAIPEDIKALRINLKHIEKMLRSRDRLGIVAAKAEFYSILVRVADNEQLAEILKKFFGQMSLLWPTMIVQSSEAEGSVSEIEAIIDAIEAHNPDAAEKAFRIHIENAARLTLEFMQEQELKK